uniref:Uncharacterized protein n=1 Tax=Arundo donax TaxID=35708 RepID=A0A0A9HS06_ARUDO
MCNGACMWMLDNLYAISWGSVLRNVQIPCFPSFYFCDDTAIQPISVLGAALFRVYLISLIS